MLNMRCSAEMQVVRVVWGERGKGGWGGCARHAAVDESRDYRGGEREVCRRNPVAKQAAYHRDVTLDTLAHDADAALQRSHVLQQKSTV
jgi:hypothetical protein